MNKYFNDIVSHFDKYPTPAELANYIVKHNVSTDTIQDVVAYYKYPIVDWIIAFRKALNYKPYVERTN